MKIDSVNNINNVSTSDLQLIWDYTVIITENFSVFRLGPMKVKRKGLITTMVGFLLYCLYILLQIRKSV